MEFYRCRCSHVAPKYSRSLMVTTINKTNREFDLLLRKKESVTALENEPDKVDAHPRESLPQILRLGKVETEPFQVYTHRRERGENILIRGPTCAVCSTSPWNPATWWVLRHRKKQCGELRLELAGRGEGAVCSVASSII